MELARARLINMLSNYQGYIGEDIAIVFDSSIMETAHSSFDTPGNIRVIYAPNKQGADIFIENMVSSCETPEDITVVTQDRLERDAVIRCGAKTIIPEKFEEEVIKVCERRMKK